MPTNCAALFLFLIVFNFKRDVILQRKRYSFFVDNTRVKTPVIAGYNRTRLELSRSYPYFETTKVKVFKVSMLGFLDLIWRVMESERIEFLWHIRFAVGFIVPPFLKAGYCSTQPTISMSFLGAFLLKLAILSQKS